MINPPTDSIYIAPYKGFYLSQLCTTYITMANLTYVVATPAPCWMQSLTLSRH